MAEDNEDPSLSLNFTTSEVVNQDEHFGTQRGKLTNKGNMDFNLGDLTTYSVRTLQEKLKIFYQDNFNLRHEVFLLRENIKTMSKFNEFELAKQIQYLQQENEEKYKSIEEKNKLLKTLMEVIEQKEDELNSQMSKNSQLANDVERLRKEGTPIRSEIDITSLELKVQEHGKCTQKEQYYVQQLDELSRLKDVQDQRIIQLKLQLSEKDSVEDQLHSEIGQLNSRLSQFEGRLELANVCYDENRQLKSQLESLKATVTLRDETIAELRLKISQIEEMHRQNKLMKNDSGIMFSEPDIVSSSSEKFAKVDFVKDNRNIVITNENANNNRLTPPPSLVDFNRLLQQKDDEKNKALEIANKLIEYLEDLARFLVNLFKKKEFSQLLNTNEFASLKSFVEQSLDISRKLTTSLSMSVTNDCNLTELIEIIDQSKNFENIIETEREQDDDNIQNLRDKIEMLKIEIQLRDDNVKIVANETIPVNLAAPLALPPIVDHSESETWSEPDRQVSLERMGIVDDYFKNLSSKIPKIKYRHSWNNEILSSSTDEECRLNKITEHTVQKTMWMLKEEISNLNKKFLAKCQEIHKLKAINKEHERTKSDLEASLNKSRKELQELKKKDGQDFNFDKVEELANRVESVQKLKQRYIQKYQEFKRIMSDIEEGHKNQTVDLKNTIVELQKNLDSLTLTASQAAIERTKVISENHKLSEDLRVVSEKMQTIEDDFKAERNDRQLQIVQFEQKEMKLEIRISELEFLNATLKNQLTSLENVKKTTVSNNVASSPIKLPEPSKNESSDYFSEDNHQNEGDKNLPSRYSASLKNNSELLAENCELKRQLQQSKQSLLNTLRELEISNERREGIEMAICNKVKNAGKMVTVAKKNVKLLSNKKPAKEG